MRIRRERERQQRRQLLRRGSSFQDDRRPGSGGQTPAIVQVADRAASLPSVPQAPASQSTDDTRSEVSVDAQQRLNSQLGSSSQAPSSPAGSARMYPPEEDVVAQPPARALLPCSRAGWTNCCPKSR